LPSQDTGKAKDLPWFPPASTYENNPVALHLGTMNMLYEAIKERGAMVSVPSPVVETMGLGGMLATASLGGAKRG
jgi:hypothetical protein